MFLKISHNFTEKNLYWSLFKKVTGLDDCKLIKKRLQHSYFPTKFAKLLRSPFLENTLSNCFWILIYWYRKKLFQYCSWYQWNSKDVCWQQFAGFRQPVLPVTSLLKKSSFSLRIFSVNVTKSTASSGFGHIYWRNSYWKFTFFVQWYIDIFSGFL